MNNKELLGKAILGNWRDKDWKYLNASEHNDSSKFRDRMEERRKLIPVTSHVFVKPTENK